MKCLNSFQHKRPVTMRHALAAAVGAVTLAAAAAASAGQQVLDAVHTGLVTSGGKYASFTYLTGVGGASDSESSGFLIFDLSSVAPNATVTSAMLRVQNRAAVNEVNSDPLQLNLYGVPLISSIYFRPGQLPEYYAGLFSFIGSDVTPMYADAKVKPHVGDSFVEMMLNADGIKNLQSSFGFGFYAFGMKVDKADREEPKPLQYVFGSSTATELGFNQVQLVLDVVPNPVPEPASLWLTLFGIAFVGARLHSRRARAARQAGLH